MKEKILAALKTKFIGVDDAILNRIADKKAIGVTDESQVTSIVEGVGFADVLNSYGDFRANTAVTSAVQNYEKKYGLKEGKPIENPNPEPNPNQVPPTDMAKAIAEAVNAAVKPLTEKLSAYESQSLQEKRNGEIMAKAKEYGIPEFIIKGKQIADEADLDTFCKDLKQEMTNAGYEGVKAPENPDQVLKTESEDLAKMINDGTQEIVEQNKK